jgi:hypothetical protein
MCAVRVRAVAVEYRFSVREREERRKSVSSVPPPYIMVNLECQSFTVDCTTNDILDSCRKLKAEGYVFEIPKGWHDVVLWQRLPTVATIMSEAKATTDFDNA